VTLLLGLLAFGQRATRAPSAVPDPQAGGPAPSPSKLAWQLLAQYSAPAPQSSVAGWEQWPAESEMYTSSSAAMCGELSSITKHLRQSEELKATYRILYERRLKNDLLNGRRLDEKHFQLPSWELPGLYLKEEPPSDTDIRYSPDLCKDVMNGTPESLGNREPPYGNLLQGQAKEAIFDELHKPPREVEFRDGSVAIKTKWEQVVGPCPKEFHCSNTSAGLAKMTAIHLAAKLPGYPNWFWATWEHASRIDRSNPKEQCCFDTFGCSKPDGSKLSDYVLNLLKDKRLDDTWANMRLIGTQTAFDNPPVLGNYLIEGDLIVKTSSCITCHSRSTTNANGNSLEVLRCGSESESANGPAQDCWYRHDNKTVRVRLGFLWDLTSSRSECACDPEPQIFSKKSFPTCSPN
jgi:hypothetical protein